MMWWIPACAGAPAVESAPEPAAPVPVPAPPPTPLDGAVEIAAGVATFCGRTPTEVLCWGVGFGATAAPVALPGPAQALGVGRTRYDPFACAVVAGEVWCWGRGQNGVLGPGAPIGPDAVPPRAVPGTEGAVAVSAGAAHVCALLGDGSVRCWGLGSEGQLGTPGPGAAWWTRAAPEAVPGLPRITQVRAAASHTCAVGADGSVWCWGSNAHGQVGGAPGTDPRPPRRVAGLDRIVAVGTGDTHTCALDRDGRVACFGERAEGRTASGVEDVPWPSPQPAAARVLGLPPADRLEVGPDASCARAPDGWWCWGSGEGPAMGAEAPYRMVAPTRVAAWDGAAAVALGGGSACLLGDPVRCLGENRDGQLGNGGAGTRDATARPRPVEGLPPTTAGAGGPAFHAAVGADGRAWWWGNPSGETWRGRGAPAAFADGVTAVAAGSDRICALAGGDLRCATGGGLAAGAALAPVPGMEGLAGVSVGGREACGWTADGALRCVADPCLGPGDPGATCPGPVTAVEGLGPVVQASVGWWGACATDRAGTVWCRGANDRGQQGDGGGAARTAFAPVAGLPPAAQVELGAAHACARTQGGEVWCWGASDQGQAGATGDPADRASDAPRDLGGMPGRPRPARPDPAPVTVRAPRALPGLAGVTDLAVGAEHGCAVANGAVRCWGSNRAGQAGEPSFDAECPGITEIASDYCKTYAFFAPIPVPGLADVVDLAAGGQHTCATDRQGGVRCWGDAAGLQLGPAFGTFASVPVEVRR